MKEEQGISLDKILKLADSMGIKYEFVDEDQSGFFVTNPDGIERKLTVEEILMIPEIKSL